MGRQSRAGFFSLIAHLLRTVQDNFLIMIGFALLSALLSLVAAFVLVLLINALTPNSFGGRGSVLQVAVFFPVVLAHAVFLTVVSRKMARCTPGYSLPVMSSGRWLESVGVIAAILTIAALIAGLFPFPEALAVILLLAILFAWSPILPRLCLNAGKGQVGDFLATLPTAMGLSFPFLLLTAFVGLPALACTGECWGLMEGGIIMLPLFGLHTFLATITAASVSAVVYSTQAVASHSTGEAG